MVPILVHNECFADESKGRCITGALLPVEKRGLGLATEPLVTLSDPVQENAISSIIRFSDAFFIHKGGVDSYEKADNSKTETEAHQQTS